MRRKENLNRLSKIKSINTSSKNYLAYVTFFKDLQNAITNYGKGRLLDIGCGNKPYEEWFKNIIDEYVGCDIVQSSAKKVDVICEANNIPIEDESFETIFSTQVIEHLEDYEGMVKEAYRLLKPGGTIILSGPMYWHLHEEPHDFYRFTKYGFKYIFEKIGFKVISTKENGGSWSTLGLMINHTFGFQNPDAHKFVKIAKSLFHKLRMHIFINRLFLYLDNRDYNTINTMNYVIVAKKSQL